LLPPEKRAAAIKRGLVRITCESSSVLKTVIAQSDAITVMNTFMMLDELRSGKLIALPSIDLGVGGQFGIVRLPRRSFPPLHSDLQNCSLSTTRRWRRMKGLTSGI
jgi:DNA-binding transcriptional LysR family regulator